MQKQDKIFLASLGVTALLLVGIMAENIRSVLLPPGTADKIDVTKVKAAITQAGIIPYGAKYWKVIENKQPKD